MNLLSQAILNHATELEEARPRLERIRELVGHATDLGFLDYLAMYALCLQFKPDTIVELGRGYGNSTAVFTDVSHQTGGRVRSYGFDHGRAWHTQTEKRLAQEFGDAWLRPLHAEHTDILKVSPEAMLNRSERVLLLWDAHGIDLAGYCLGRLFPALASKENIVIVHDITDADAAFVKPDYFREDGLPTYWMGRFVAPFAEIVPVFDFLSRNRVEVASALDAGPEAIGRLGSQDGGSWIYFTVAQGHAFPADGFQRWAKLLAE